MTAMWVFLAVIFLAGALGGLVNAFLTDNGFIFARTEVLSGTMIFRPGFFGNAFIGGIAAVVSYGLYGAFATEPVLSNTPPLAPATNATGPSAAEVKNPRTTSLVLSTFVGALLVGIGGARVLSSEVDKRLLK